MQLLFIGLFCCSALLQVSYSEAFSLWSPFIRSFRGFYSALLPAATGSSAQEPRSASASARRRHISRSTSPRPAAALWSTRESWFGIRPMAESGTCDAGDEQYRHDMWIVGAGTLGTLVAQEWRRRYPHSTIVMETLTETRHDRIRSLGFEPRLRKDRSAADWYSAHNVLISFPPSSSANASAEVSEAARLWVGSELDGDVRYPELGLVLLTSSSGVYKSPGPPERTNAPPFVARSQWAVNERAPLDYASPRTRMLVDMEREALACNASVIRLAGLYDADRGPHSYWLSAASCGSKAGSSHRGVARDAGAAPSAHELINLIHYSDAAKAVVAVFEKSAKNAVYLASDGHPMTRREIAAAALASGLFPGATMPEFDDSAYNDAPTLRPWGKVVNCSWTMERLRWNPTFCSFKDFMERYS